MDAYFRKYFWLLNVSMLTLCCYLGARATTHFIAGAVPPPRRPVRGADRRPLVQSSLGPTTVSLAAVIRRNIFCSTCTPAQETPALGDATHDSQPASNEPMRSALPYRLIATLVSYSDPSWSFAALFDPGDNRTRLYRVGTSVGPSGAKLIAIEDRRVMIAQAGRHEFIELDGQETQNASAAQAPNPAPAANRRPGPPEAGLAAEVAAGVRSVGPNRWEIQRSALNKVLTNTTLLARSARIVPSIRNGVPDGFKLYAIRPGSIYSLIGMQNGDTINAINGHPMTTPDKALEVYTKLRNASHLSISFSRRGQTVTHDYVIR